MKHSFSKIILNFVLLFLLLTFAMCSNNNDDTYNINNNIVNKTDTSTNINLGFRYSSYGMPTNPGIDYWLHLNELFKSKFTKSTMETVWICGVLHKDGISFNFPVETNNPLIKSETIDFNEEIFYAFDRNGINVWLQVEPGHAPVDTLIRIMLNRYQHHKCIIGVGVDVEWYKSVKEPGGKAISDELAQNWLNTIQSYNKNYKLFLKHWLIEKMPPTSRKDIVFIDDSQGFESLQEMKDEFIEWGNAFKDASVGFQVGYSADKNWWWEFEDPIKTIGQELSKNVPNMESLFWVDFTLLKAFPKNSK